LVVIDYQPSQIAAVRSMDRDLLLKNVVSTVKTARLFGLPIAIPVEPALSAFREVDMCATSRFADSVREDPVLDASQLRESARRARRVRLISKTKAVGR